MTGTSTANLTETDVVLTATGTLIVTDPDSPETFVARNAVAGSNGYGTFSIDTNGLWNYSTNGAHNEFAAGQSYTDSFTVSSADGTTKVVTVTMTGTNDAAVISGTSAVSVTETNAAITATGTLSATDVDGTANLFTAQSGVSGNNNYGTFSIGTNGVWTYTANSAHNEFVGGQTYTDSITVTAADGTPKVVTVTMTGTNDAAVISGTSAVSVTETDAALSATGTLSATDVDGTANLFTAQSGVSGNNNYGTFSIGTNGVWTYTANSAHNEFVGGQTYTDSITVTAADGTPKVVTVTMTGTNDAAVISGTSSASVSETNAAITATGTLSATDVDSSSAFVA
ncbi:adhesin, partial [Chlorobium sp. BLA1]|uniref:VCBS domain-containing protein n=1 Tax=Candidatus Chlorobium masyuteum TaxID=2716876 RepID=UPI0038B3013A|nr:adhesin [Candidatus Chlorobium masyuteum]